LFQTPILLLIFNRPETTEKVFNAIRNQKPKYLFIAADGPRQNNEADIDLCKRAREIVAAIDWDCEVKKLFRDKNLGCGAGPAQAITWFFENVEQGIILEDDILPDPSFFLFCQDMLNYFKNDTEVMHISGCYFLELFEGGKFEPESYYFTQHIHVWGWATWRRAWKHYDYDMKGSAALNVSKSLTKYYGGYSIFWRDIFEGMTHKGNDIWDYQWMFAIYKHNGIAINPTKNLTTNIGFGNNATHTTDAGSIFTKVKLSSLSKLIHATGNKIDTARDALYYKHFLNFDLGAEIAKRNFIWKLKKYLRKLKARFYANLM
jgi:hypothetical protein